mmetsp:Transcript_9360/g.16083  ORF Transcript_9360/g.16083 Transcript_9360/m.16083 type:complete len:310 (-) Transcript_9360:445-1374(-)
MAGDLALPAAGGGLVQREADVTLLAPLSAPRVLDDVEWVCVFCVHAHCEHAVIDLLAAEATKSVEDSTSIELPEVGGNGDGDWLVRDRLLEGRLAAHRHVLVPAHVHPLRRVLLCRVTALAVVPTLARVGILLLGDDSSYALDERVSVFHDASVASLVLGIARDQVLLRKGYQFPGVEEVHALDGSGGRKRPTAAALPLVLHFSHSALLTPVDGTRDFSVRVLEACRLRQCVRRGFRPHIPEHLLELVSVQVHERPVEAQHPGLVHLHLCSNSDNGVGDFITSHVCARGCVIVTKSCTISFEHDFKSER